MLGPMRDPSRLICPHCQRTVAVEQQEITAVIECGACARPLFTGSVVRVGEQEATRHITTNTIPTMLVFWAPWCSSCTLMDSIVRVLAYENEPDLRVLKLNTDDATDIVKSMKIRSIPTLVLMADGREVTRHTGPGALPDIDAWFSEALVSAQGRPALQQA